MNENAEKKDEERETEAGKGEGTPPTRSAPGADPEPGPQGGPAAAQEAQPAGGGWGAHPTSDQFRYKKQEKC